MYISASRHEIHDISDRTYFQKPEEIIHGLREVVQILSSWKSDKLHLSFHLSFSVDFRRSSGQKSRKILSIGRPFTSWRLRTARNARDSDWKVLWVFFGRNAGPLANACVRLKKHWARPPAPRSFKRHLWGLNAVFLSYATVVICVLTARSIAWPDEKKNTAA